MQWVGWPDRYSTSQDVIHQQFPECAKMGVCVGISPLSCIFLHVLHFLGGLNNCQDMKSVALKAATKDYSKDSVPVMMERQHSLCICSCKCHGLGLAGSVNHLLNAR